MLLSRKCLSVITVAAVLSLSGSAFAATPKCNQECVHWVTETLAGEWYAHAAHFDAFLTCTRHHESAVGFPYPYDENYGIDTGNGYFGAFQFKQSTFDNVARHAGWYWLVGVNPARASVSDQDFMALNLFEWQGSAPWGGRCPGLQ